MIRFLKRIKSWFTKPSIITPAPWYIIDMGHCRCLNQCFPRAEIWYDSYRIAECDSMEDAQLICELKNTPNVNAIYRLFETELQYVEFGNPADYKWLKDLMELKNEPRNIHDTGK